MCIRLKNITICWDKQPVHRTYTMQDSWQQYHKWLERCELETERMPVFRHVNSMEGWLHLGFRFQLLSFLVCLFLIFSYINNLVNFIWYLYIKIVKQSYNQRFCCFANKIIRIYLYVFLHHLGKTKILFSMTNGT